MDRKQESDPDLSTVLRNLKRSIFKEINCVQIGTIQSFNAENQTATIQLSIKAIVEEQRDGSQEVRDRPLLLECPCLILSGADNYLSFPITNGDPCIVLFNDRDIDNWFVSGDGAPPNTIRTHDLSDAFALVGIRNAINPISDYFTGGIRLQHSASNKIELSGTQINVTANFFNVSGDVVATGDVSDSNATNPTMQNMRTVFNSHTHGGGSAPDQQM